MHSAGAAGHFGSRKEDRVMTKSRLLAFAITLAAVGGLTACTSTFDANVSRFHQALPPPAQGQSFAVLPDDARNEGSLEFAHYADLVAQRLTQLGYQRADGAGSAQLVVHLSYGVDNGHDRVVGSVFRHGYYGRDIYPVVVGGGRHGRRVRYVVGYRDPFLWDWDYPYDGDLDSYTVYQSQLKLRIDKAGGGRVFEGTASARSLSNRLTYLVPNLVDALFQDFPGKDGEQIKVTIAPEPRGKN